MGARSSRNTTQNNRSDGHLLEYFRNTFVRGGGGTNPPAKATGGLISFFSGKTIHQFLSSGTFTVTSPTLSSVEYVVVAGGGGGGGGTASDYAAGGGGAGGFRTNISGHPLAGSAFPVSPGPYGVTVGAGGAGFGPGRGNGSPGGTSSFGPISTNGGGGGEEGCGGGEGHGGVGGGESAVRA